MEKTCIIKQITLSGLLIGLAIIIGLFLHFPLFGGQVYLIGIIIFVMPLFLRIDMLIISAISSVVLVDVISGFGQYSWMSAIAYGLAIIPIWLMLKLQFKIFYFISLIISSLIIIATYYFLERITFGSALAFKDFLATSLQMAIVVPIVIMLYWPLKMASKIL
ncbi:hypothetical protein [Candidatus Mycoplasma mahonii]|uniref:hypothetical protein n=1 Tax=Candidatus Mycoplasma mahonii TaxID=3004105 RepID=UPI0026F244FD|nr:hypothetical protein [Candidatus Mycoplasma mahonii]WKX02805.1 hypothetical protein O3I44_01900 [Candidatus Mycoplasma mahonii]